MNYNSSHTENLRRIFTEGFTVRDIAEPLVSFDNSTDAVKVRALLEVEDFDVAGVRARGRVVGMLERSQLRSGACGEQMRPIDEGAVISDGASLSEVVSKLDKSPRLFVHALGALGGIVTMSDLQKPAVRMWLFGMVTLIEMRMGRLVEQVCQGDSWQQFLSEGRLQKATDLLEQRRQRSQNLRLIDCLQFADKAQIIARNEEIRSLTRYTSRRQVEEMCRDFENLRNNLAHAQDIIATDWPIIVTLSADLDGIILGTPAVRAAIGEG